MHRDGGYGSMGPYLLQSFCEVEYGFLLIAVLPCEAFVVEPDFVPQVGNPFYRFNRKGRVTAEVVSCGDTQLVFKTGHVNRELRTRVNIMSDDGPFPVLPEPTFGILLIAREGIAIPDQFQVQYFQGAQREILQGRCFK